MVSPVFIVCLMKCVCMCVCMLRCIGVLWWCGVCERGMRGVVNFNPLLFYACFSFLVFNRSNASTHRATA